MLIPRGRKKIHLPQDLNKKRMILPVSVFSVSLNCITGMKEVTKAAYLEEKQR